MLKFRTKEGRAGSRAPNYLGHKFQRPWIFALFVIACAVWLLRGGDIGSISNVLKPKPAEVALVEETQADGKPLDNLVPKQQPGVVRGERPLNPVEGKKLFHNVNPKLFTKLEDDITYRFDERLTLATLMKTLGEADERDLEIAAKAELNFRQLSEQTDAYRGEIVTVGGVIKRPIVELKLEGYPLDAKTLYEVWVFPPNGGRLPIVIDVLELPPGFPKGDKAVGQYVKATGFYYKRLGYQEEPTSKSKKPEDRASPLVIAKSLSWSPKAGANAKLENARDQAVEQIPGLPKGLPVDWVMPLLGLGMVVMIVVAVWAFRLSRSSVADRGPIVGRLRREAEEARNPMNLNKLKIDP